MSFLEIKKDLRRELNPEVNSDHVPLACSHGAWPRACSPWHRVRGPKSWEILRCLGITGCCSCQTRGSDVKSQTLKASE